MSIENAKNFTNNKNDIANRGNRRAVGNRVSGIKPLRGDIKMTKKRALPRASATASTAILFSTLKK